MDVLFDHMHQQGFIQSRPLFVYLADMRARGGYVRGRWLLYTWQPRRAIA